MWGFQLWINLPARDKMTAPRYQDVDPEAIPTVERPDGCRIRVIAGRVDEIDGAVSSAATDPTYLDITVPPGGRFDHRLPADHAAFIYVFEGSADVGEGAAVRQVDRGQLAVLSPGGAVAVTTAAETPARLILVAARKLDEPVARHGPFVMNTEAEIRQAIEDFRAGRF